MCHSNGSFLLLSHPLHPAWIKPAQVWTINIQENKKNQSAKFVHRKGIRMPGQGTGGKLGLGLTLVWTEWGGRVDAGLVMESPGRVEDAGGRASSARRWRRRWGGGAEAAPCLVGDGAYRRFDPTSTDLQRRRPWVQAPPPRLRAASSGDMATPAPH